MLFLLVITLMTSSRPSTVSPTWQVLSRGVWGESMNESVSEQ